MEKVSVVEPINKVFFYKGMTFLEPNTDSISDTPFYWQGEHHPVGTKFQRLGSNPRTSLCIGWNLVYCGQISDYVLFTHDAPTKVPIQSSLFEQPKKKAFIAILYLDDDNLLMQTSEGGFYDIRG